MTARIVHASRTDIGLRRQRNEDYLAVEQKLGLYVVADGMGGHEHGDVASRIAVQTVVAAVGGGEDLTAAIHRANRHILSESSGTTLLPMGTTICAASFLDSSYQVAWVGDSRAYLYDGRFRRLTTDHTYVQEMVLRGEIEARSARRHPYRNMLIQALGVTDNDELQVDIVDGDLQENSGLLLCTDGLIEGLDDNALHELIAENPGDVESVADRLLQHGLERGGSDNITLIWIWRPGEAEASP